MELGPFSIRNSFQNGLAYFVVSKMPAIFLNLDHGRTGTNRQPPIQVFVWRHGAKDLQINGTASNRCHTKEPPRFVSEILQTALNDRPNPSWEHVFWQGAGGHLTEAARAFG